MTPNTVETETKPTRIVLTRTMLQSLLVRVGVYCLALVVLTLACMPPQPSADYYSEEIGRPARKTIIAPRDFSVEKLEETIAAREAAKAQSPTYFTILTTNIREVPEKWRLLRQVAAGGDLETATQEDASLKDSVLAFWNGLGNVERRYISELFEDPDRDNLTRQRLMDTMQSASIADFEVGGKTSPPFPTTGQPVWVKRQPLLPGSGVRSGEGLGDTQYISADNIRSTTSQVESLTRMLRNELDLDQDDREAVGAVEQLTRFIVKPTIQYAPDLTVAAREEAAAAVEPVVQPWTEGQAVTRRGETVTVMQGAALSFLQDSEGAGFSGRFLGKAMAVLVLLGLFNIYLVRNHPKVYASPARLASILTQIGLVVWTGFFVAWGNRYGVFATADSQVFQVGLMIPVAAVGILLTLLENPRIGLFSVIISVLLIGSQAHWDFSILLVLAVSSIVAVYQVSRADRRSRIYLACPWIIATGFVLLLGDHLANNPTPTAFLAGLPVLYHGLFWISINGLLSIGLVLLLLPMLEDLLGITTEFRLREISTYHPLLRQLEEKAPGTYYHSLNVSALGESAASAIGANATLVKVAAYYHDIGKMEKPQYFSENQFTEEDKKRHAKISPHMSCLIIRNHVKLGLEMAREHRLPEVLHPFIAEHHGTTLLSYFYDRARQEDDTGIISESDFRYSGPKPQTVESAVLMMADSIEAASRSMNLVSENEIRLFVKRIINDKTLDGQFDECPLDLKQMKILRESFTRTLRTMMHRRIAYPSTPDVVVTPPPREENVHTLYEAR